MVDVGILPGMGLPGKHGIQPIETVVQWNELGDPAERPAHGDATRALRDPQRMRPAGRDGMGWRGKFPEVILYAPWC